MWKLSTTRQIRFQPEKHLHISLRWRSFTGAAFSRIGSDSSSLTGVSNGQGELWSPRQLTTLAIETSCDDTSVAILSISSDNACQRFKSNVLFHEKVTSNSEAFAGIHPLVALYSHQRELSPLVHKALSSPASSRQHATAGPSNLQWKPDFVSVTRGPGMRSNLSVGLDTAKGLAAAWNVPLIGIHHMQAHALTSRLCATLQSTRSPDRVLYGAIDTHDAGERTREWSKEDIDPKFPFLTVLASGGHTMLVDSTSLTQHKILAESVDIAIGDCLDKVARAILLESEMKVPYGKALEDFAFPDGEYDYTAPTRRGEEISRRQSQWGWSVTPPFAEKKDMAYSFAGILSTAETLMAQGAKRIPRVIEEVPLEERRELAREIQRLAFQHVVSRILIHLTSLPKERTKEVGTIVVSGGVAANQFFRHILRSMLDARGFQHIATSFPPVPLCTDNALMIAWAGMEMFDAGFESELSIRPLRKWSMDASAEDGGILGVGGWISRDVS